MSVSVPETCADVNMLRFWGIADGDPVRWSEDIVSDDSVCSEESGSGGCVVAAGAGTMAT